MEMGVPVIIALVAAFLVLGLLFAKFKRNRYIPYVGLAGAVFFLIYALVEREYMYPSLFFFLIFGYLSGKTLVGQKRKH